jgi:hypothetical protein
VVCAAKNKGSACFSSTSATSNGAAGEAVSSARMPFSRVVAVVTDVRRGFETRRREEKSTVSFRAMLVGSSRTFLCERLARFSEPPKRKKNPAVKCSRGEVPSGHVPHPSRRGMTMDRGGPTRRAAGRVAGGADLERVGPCPRGVRAHRGRVARGGRVARRGVRARAGANARNPNDPRIFARCPRVLRKKNHRVVRSAPDAPS